MSKLKVSALKDLTGAQGFMLAGGGITASTTLTVSNIVVNGEIKTQSSYFVPPVGGHSGKALKSTGSSYEWSGVSAGGGIRSMQSWTNNGTWYRPQGVTTIIVTVVGAGGGGSGFCEAGGAGGMSERVIDVTNVSSVNVTCGNPGGGTNYSGCGGNGNTSSFGSYCNASGGIGANCSQNRCGGYGGNGSGGSLNIYGGGGNGHGSYWAFGNHTGGTSFIGGSQPCSHNQSNYAYNHQSHAAWGAGGNGSKHGNRGAGGRNGCVIVQEFYG